MTKKFLFACLVFSQWLFPLPIARADGLWLVTNRRMDVLRRRPEPKRQRELIARAGSLLGERRVHLAGATFDGRILERLAAESPDEPFVRVVRERLGRPVDVADLIYFLDDVLMLLERGCREAEFWVGAGCARGHGILLHPSEVFGHRARRYGVGRRRLYLDRPLAVTPDTAAQDGAPLGPDWFHRFPDPSGRERMLAALGERNPGTFAARVRSLIRQLEEQGAEVRLTSTVRDPRRGYLMWGAHMLASLRNRWQVKRWVHILDRLNRAWNVRVPIRWNHPQGWRATIQSARAMTAAYSVVFASRFGARKSNHYQGRAVDLVAVNLPRRVLLEAPDGSRRWFDLSMPGQSRDLNLSPGLIDWIELHFQMKKLRNDYPHWDDDQLPLAPVPLASLKTATQRKAG